MIDWGVGSKGREYYRDRIAALAHGAHVPMHGGVLTMAEEAQFELVKPPRGVDVYVIADDGGVAGECREGNNLTVFRGVYCGVIF